MKQQYNHFESIIPSKSLSEALQEYDKYLNNREGVDASEIYNKLYEAIKREEMIKHNTEINKKLTGHPYKNKFS